MDPPRKFITIYLLSLASPPVVIDKIYAAKDFAYCSFAFSVVTGFCIGGTALANIIGIGYVNKRLSLRSSLLIAMVFEILGNVLLSR
jgi:hypothetical protein